MVRTAPAILLIGVLLGCPFFCLTGSMGAHGQCVTGDFCQRSSADVCRDDFLGDENAPHGEVPCDHDECPQPDCICAGALAAVVADDTVADDAGNVEWLNVPEDAQVAACRGFSQIGRDLPSGLSALDAQCRCALFGSFLL